MSIGRSVERISLLFLEIVGQVEQGVLQRSERHPKRMNALKNASV
jgi:hypothetical protein